MNRILRFLGVAFALVSQGALAAPVRLELPLQKATLDNGLRVVMNVDKGTRAVAVSVVFDVGTRDEAPGQAGFARVVEELAFAETKNLGAGEFQTLVTARGGFFTSKTYAAETVFSTVLPENELALGLWLEAERMRNFAPSAASLEAARRTLNQEFEGDPSPKRAARLREMVFQDVFAYAHPTYGKREELDKTTLVNLEAFHKQHYGPNAAIVSLSGDFDPDTAMSLVHRYFDGIPAGHTSPFATKALPAQEAERRDVLISSATETTILSYGFPAPNVKEPGFWALTLAAIILGDGEGSRLKTLLVHKKDALAKSVHAEMPSLDDRSPGLVEFEVTLNSTSDPKEVEKIVDDAFLTLASKRPTDAEIKRAKTRVEAMFLRGITSHADRSMRLARYELCLGDSRFLLRAMDPLETLGAEDVQKAAALWLTKNHRSVLETRPKPSPAAMASATSEAL